MVWRPHRRSPKPDLDERFTLFPQSGEDALRQLLDADTDEPQDREDEDS